MGETPLDAIEPVHLVVLHSIYDCFEQPGAKELFPRVVGLRSAALPAEKQLLVDVFDFVGTHHLVCRQASGTLWPIAGFRSVSLKRCVLHNLEFPPLLWAAQAPELPGMIDDHAPENILWHSHWVQAPMVFTWPGLAPITEGLLAAAHLRSLPADRPFLSFWTPEAGFPERVEQLGYRRISSSEVTCGLSALPPLWYMNALCSTALDDVERYRRQLEARDLFCENRDE